MSREVALISEMKKNPTHKLNLKYCLFAVIFFAAALIFSVSPHGGIRIIHAQGNPTPPQSTTPPAAPPTSPTTPPNTPPAAPTQTPGSWSCISNLATCSVTYLTIFISGIFDLFVLLGAFLITLGLKLTAQVYNFNAVQSGFAVTLSIANLGFVLALIIIAIATILRRETYGYKQTLWRLIAMAILINFGLVITAPIVGFANGISSYFTNSIQGGTAGISAFTTNMANQLQVGAAQQAPTLDSQNSPADTFAQALLSLVFTIIFKFVVVMAFFTLGILLFLRFIWLAVLLIVLPFAWITWIFPSLSHEFSNWWQKFIHWTFFSPAALFFIWLAMNISQGFIKSASTGSTAGGALASATGLPGVVDQLANNIIVVGIMIGGLLAASKLAGGAGSFAVKQAKSVSGAIQGYVGRKTRSGARTLGRSVSDRVRGAGKQYNPATRETTTWLQRQGSRLQAVPGLRGTGAALARQTSPDAIKKSREVDIQNYIDHELKALPSDGLLARANSKTALVNPTTAAALAQELARRNLTDRVSASRMEGFVAAADRLGNLEKVTANRPDLMPRRRDPATGAFIESREEATARAVRSAKSDIIQADADTFDTTRIHRPGMTHVEVERAVLSLSPAQLAALGSDTTAPRSQDRQNNITNAVRDLIASIPGLVRLNPANGKNELDPAVLAAAIARRPELANLSKMVKHMDQSQNWDSVI